MSITCATVSLPAIGWILCYERLRRIRRSQRSVSHSLVAIRHHFTDMTLLLFLADLLSPCTAPPSVKIWSENLRPLNTFLPCTSACPTRPLSPEGISRSEHCRRLGQKERAEKNGAGASYTILGHQPISPRAAFHHTVFKPLKTHIHCN